VLRLAGAAGVLLATTVDGTAGTVRTQALDLATGRQLWANPAEEFLHSHSAAPTVAGRGTGADRTVRWTDLRTDRAIWSRPLRAGTEVNVISGAAGLDRVLPAPDRVLLTQADGDAELLAEATAGRWPPAGSARQRPVRRLGDLTGNMLMTFALDGRLLVSRPRDGYSATLVAYDPATLTPQWTVTGAYRGYAVPCGMLICLPASGR